MHKVYSRLQTKFTFRLRTTIEIQMSFKPFKQYAAILLKMYMHKSQLCAKIALFSVT